MSSDKIVSRYRAFAISASIFAMGQFAAAMPTISESRHKMTRGGSTKHLPGGRRGMSQRQRRKRIRQGIL